MVACGGLLAWFLNLAPVVQIAAFTGLTVTSCVLIREVTRWHGRPALPRLPRGNS